MRAIKTNFYISRVEPNGRYYLHTHKCDLVGYVMESSAKADCDRLALENPGLRFEVRKAEGEKSLGPVVYFAAA